MKIGSRTVQLAAVVLLGALAPACSKKHHGGGGAAAARAFVVTLTSLAVTSESGGTATFTVRLTTQPTASVTIDVTSDDPGEGTPDVATLTFNPGSATTAQTVTVTGVDDALLDGNIVYNIVLDNVVSADAGYAALDPADVALTNNDNEVVAITVTPTALTDMIEGQTRTFDVSLGAPPTGAVLVPITVTTGVGQVKVSGFGSGGQVDTFNLSLDAANMTRTVTVHGLDDGVQEATLAYVITTGDPTSGDAAYDALVDADVPNVTGNLLDNDTSSIVVTPTTASGGSTLLTHEGGGTDTFRVRLGTAVVGEVTLTLTGVDATEGTASTATVVFTAGTGLTFQTVTVTGVDDALTDGDIEYAITLTATNTGGNAADDPYIGLFVDVFVTNVDLDGGVWTGPLPPGVSPPFSAPTATPGVALGAAGAFDDFEATDPAVIFGLGTEVFEMYYRGRNQDGTKDDNVGRTGSDLADFSVRTPSLSVLGGDSINGSWKKVGVGRPSVAVGDLDADGNVNPVPTSAVTATAGAGGSITPGDHRWFVTFVGPSGESGVGSSRSNLLTIVGVTEKADLSGIPLGPGGTTARNIYRTTAGGTTPLLVDTIANNTDTTYVDTKADGALGAAAPTGDTYIMFYSGRRSGFYDGIDWVTSGDGYTDPMVSPYGVTWSAPAPVPGFQASGVGGQFDQTTVTDPWVLFQPADAGAEFKMWYTGEGAGGVLQIGYATADLSGGVPGTWTRSATASIASGPVGSFRERVSAPTVVFDSVAGLYRMYFTCHDLARNRTTIGYAQSATVAGPWTVFPTPVLVPDTSGVATWADQNVFAPSVLISNAGSTAAGTGATGDILHVWYSGTGSGGEGIGHVSVTLP